MERAMGRGYFGIGVLNPKVEENIGTLWRHARLYGAEFIFTIGRRYKKQASDTSATSRHIPLYHYKDFEDFESHLPLDCKLICVELEDDSVSLPDFRHPERAVYLLGAEDHGIPREITIDRPIIQIPAVEPQSMNVSVSGTLVMYDRFTKSAHNSEEDKR